MSDFGTMIARINDEVGRPELAARISAAVQSAIRYYEDERFWFNEGESTASTINGQANYALPDDFVEPDALTLTYSSTIRRELTRRSWDWMRKHNTVTDLISIPSDWAYYADQIWLYPTPDGVYTLTMSFLKRQTALSVNADTNAWMTHGERLIRCRAKQDLFEYAATQQLDLQMVQRDLALMAAMRVATEDAFEDLRAKSEQKIASGTLSFDDGVLMNRGGYNINYE